MAVDGARDRRPRALLAARVIILLAAAGAVAAAFLVLRPGAPGGAAPAAYVCPMHREVASPAPAACPICGMALVAAPASASDRAPDPAATESVAAAGVRTSDVTIVRPRAVSHEMTGPGWVDADRVVNAILYRDELLALASGDRVRFQPADAPEVEAVFAGGEPGAWDDSTAIARFTLAPGAPSLRAGAAGRVLLPARTRELLAIPETTVLRSPHGPCVFVASPDGASFTRRYVELGASFFDMNVVVSGLAAGERVAVGLPFFLDAALRARDAVAHAGSAP